MSRLSDLYKAMETLRKEGLPVNDVFEQKVYKKEEYFYCDYPLCASYRIIIKHRN